MVLFREDLRNEEPDIMRTDVMQLICNQQVQLEKIRASETEVRWQHEDDVDVCTNCQMSFLASEAPGKPKHHCKHCGKVRGKKLEPTIWHHLARLFKHLSLQHNHTLV